MVAKAFVQARNIAGLTRELAKGDLVSDLEMTKGRTMFGDRRYKVLAVRIAPPLEVARRFRALVTWVPVR